jgi:hypothetical protein
VIEAALAHGWQADLREPELGRYQQYGTDPIAHIQREESGQLLIGIWF